MINPQEYQDLYDEINAMEINDLLIWDKQSTSGCIKAIQRNAHKLTNVVGTVAYHDTLYIVCVDRRVRR